MTPDTQARAGHRRPQVRRADSGTTSRSGGTTAEAARTRQWDAFAHPSPSYPLPRTVAAPADGRRRSSRAAERAARHAREDAAIAKVIPFLVVLIVTVAGVYIAWLKGSTGGSEGGVVGGVALLAAAVVRLLLPARLAGLLATRKRAIDVTTLAVFGTCLLVAGLVLPR